MRPTFCVSAIVLALALGGGAVSSGGCGGDGGVEPESGCGGLFVSGAGHELWHSPCGLIVAAGVKEASFECEQRTLDGKLTGRWSGTATVTRNNLGQMISYTATINGETCTFP